MSTTVLVIDDHPLIGMALSSALRLEGLSPHWVAGPGVELDQALRELDPGLVLLDLDLGKDSTGAGVDGGQLISPLVHDGWTVLVVSGAADQDRLVDAVAHGAVGWVGKDTHFERLVATAVAAARGDSVLSTADRRALLAERRARRSAERSRRGRLAQLTTREREVLHELAHGRRVSDIADDSHVAVATVRTQVKAIRNKLGVASQLEAVALYRSTGAVGRS